MAEPEFDPLPENVASDPKFQALPPEAQAIVRSKWQTKFEALPPEAQDLVKAKRAAPAAGGLADPAAAAADLEATLPTKRTTLAQALATPPTGLMKAVEEMPSGDPRAAMGKGVAKFVVSQMTPGNAALMGGLGAAPAAVARPAAGIFGAQAALHTIKSIPELWNLYQNKEYDKFVERATEAGLSGVVAALGLAHGVGAPTAPAAEAPTATPAEAPIAPLKVAQQAAKAVEGVGPETKAAAQAQKTVLSVQGASPEFQQMVLDHVEEWTDLPKDKKAAMLQADKAKQAPAPERPPFLAPKAEVVEGQGGQKVVPNDEADPALQESLKEAIRKNGGDPENLQQQADMYTQIYGLKKPIRVESVGDVDVSEAAETPDDYPVKLAGPAKKAAGQLSHEAQHPRVEEGQIPEVPEGPGANDQIVSQVTQDIGKAETVKPGKLAPLAEVSKTNYLRPLSELSDRLYHETSIDQALDLIPGSGRHVGSMKMETRYFSNDPAYALGQGANKGVIIEMDPAGLQGQANRSKPAFAPAWEAGNGELVGKYNDQKAYQNAVRSVTVKPGAEGSRVNNQILQRALSGWEKTQNPDGSTTFRPPGQPPGGQPPIPKIAEPSNINLNRLDISDESKRGIMEIANEIPREVPIPREQTIASVSEMGGTLEQAAAIADGTTDLHLWVEQVKQFSGRVANDYEAVKQRGGSPAETAAARKRMLEGVKVQADLLANVGRGLSAAAIKTKASTAADAVIELGKLINELEDKGTPKARKNAKKLAERLDRTDMSDPAARNNLRKIAGIKDWSWNQKLSYYFTSNIVSSLPTAFVKMSADAAATMSSPERTLVGSSVNRIFYELGRKGTEEFPRPKPHPIAEYRARDAAVVNALSDGLAAFTEAIKTRSMKPLAETTYGRSFMSGTNIYHREVPLGEGIRIPWSGEGASLSDRYAGTPKVIPTKVPAAIISVPFRNLGAITDSFLHTNIAGELYEQGIRDAMNRGLKDEAAWTAAREYVDSMPEEPLKTITKKQAKELGPQKVGGLETAVTEARKDTSTQAPGRFSKTLLRAKADVPGLFVETPIVTTPQNIFKVALWDMSPLGAMDVIKDMAKGEEISNARMGRAVLGSMTWVWAFNHAKAGLITGAGPTDPREFKQKWDAGWRPNSIKLPVLGYVSLRPLGSIGHAIAAAANVAEIINDAPRAKGDSEFQKYATATWDHMSRFILEMPMLQGLSNLFDALKNGTHFVPVAGGNIASGFNPYSAMQARIAASMDPYERRIDGFGAAIQARIPFWREGLSPKRDMYGEPILAAGTWPERLASPGPRSVPRDLTAVEQVYQNAKIGPVSGIMPLRVREKESGFALNREDLDRLEVITGQKVKRMLGTLEKQGTAFSARPEDDKEKIVKAMVESARAQGRVELTAELKKKAIWKAYSDAAAGNLAARAIPNPYMASMKTEDVDKATETLERYHVAHGELPKEIPHDLADQYLDQLNAARAMIFHSTNYNPRELGSLDPEVAKLVVEKLEAQAVKLAKIQTLKANPGVQSQAAAP